MGGSHWFRQTIRLMPGQAGKDAILRLGCLVNADSVYVNGIFVGTTSYQYPPRIYKVPGTILKAGNNVVTIRLITNGGSPAFVRDKPYCLAIGGDTVRFERQWKYKLGCDMPVASGGASFQNIPTGMGASFDDQLLLDVFTAVSDEARAKSTEFSKQGELKQYQGLTFWTPNINIFRDPRWGRGQETYGEDPYLTGQMGMAVVRGLQGPGNTKYDKLHACAKHFAVHSGPEWDRHSFNIEKIAPRDLWETYLPAFKDLVQRAHVLWHCHLHPISLCHIVEFLESVLYKYQSHTDTSQLVQPDFLWSVKRYSP